MPELHDGLLWRLETRKRRDVLLEMTSACARYTERLGPVRALAFRAGAAAYKLLEGTLDVKLDERLQEWDVLVTEPEAEQTGQTGQERAIYGAGEREYDGQEDVQDNRAERHTEAAVGGARSQTPAPPARVPG